MFLCLAIFRVSGAVKPRFTFYYFQSANAFAAAANAGQKLSQLLSVIYACHFYWLKWLNINPHFLNFSVLVVDSDGVAVGPMKTKSEIKD